ncbi:MAG: class B sortase [Agathobacter sp.]|nr:class B sortase [Agathobacter sp.]
MNRKKHGKPGNRVLLLTGIILIALAGYQLIIKTENYHSSNQLYEELNNKYVDEDGEVNSQDEMDWTFPHVDIEALQKENPDVAGWLYFENEKISYPLMYSGDDDTYLHTAMDGSYAYAGALFVEGENSPDFEDSHTIIYGHNMRNLSMFGRLRYYRKEDYYRKHPYFQIITADSAYRYQIFSCEDVAVDSFIYQVPFGADRDFSDFIGKLYQQSLYDTGVSADKNDKIVTLSTCSQSGRRFVVHGVRVAEERIKR